MDSPIAEIVAIDLHMDRGPHLVFRASKGESCLTSHHPAASPSACVSQGEEHRIPIQDDMPINNCEPAGPTIFAASP